MSKHTLGRSYKANGAHASVSVKAEKVEIDLDVEKLAKHPAEALAAAVSAAIRSIPLGAREGSHRLFNKTGHLAAGITAKPGAAAGTYEIVPPDDRLKTASMMERLRALLVVDERRVHEAEHKALEHAIHKRGH